MYPELFRIGNFPIDSYGILLSTGLLVALIVAARLGSKDGVEKGRIYDVGIWAIVGGFIGAKLLLVLTDNTVNVFSIDFLRSGGVFYGGLIGGFAASIIIVRWYKLPFFKVADAFAPGAALGQAIGRQGCFAAGCDWGRPTSLPWGVHFTELGHETTGVPIYYADGSDVYLHPTQLYESISMLIVFGVLIYLHRRKKFDGQVLAAYAVIYSLVRFVIEFFRDDPRGDFFGLTTLTGLSTSQLISLAVATSGAVLIYLKLRAVPKIAVP